MDIFRNSWDDKSSVNIKLAKEKVYFKIFYCISKLNSSKNTNLKLWATIIFYNRELNAMCCFGYTALEKNLDFLSGAVENGLRFNSCCPAVLGCAGLKEGRRGAHSEVCGTNRLRGVNVLYKAHWGVLLFPTVSEEFKISLKGDICI